MPCPTHPDSEPPLDDLVIEFLDRHEQEGDSVLEELCARSPAHAAALRERVATLRNAGLLSLGEEECVPETMGDFRLLKRLGGGGMGVVYLAEQTSLGRSVALKLVRPEQLYFPAARERFAREVQVVASLAHPGIAPVYTVGQHDGVPFFAMEYVDGLSIAQVLDARRGAVLTALTGRDLAPDPASDEARSSPEFKGGWVDACMRVVRQVADALEHAHRKGVLHRDLKPSNVMLTSRGRALLVDFGLARSEGADRLTRTGSTLGSAPYMAPEIAMGRVTESGPSTDVYSLGVTLYEMLTLRLPFEGETRQQIQEAVIDARPASVRAINPSVSEDLETVCLVAMDADPSRRYQTADAFARDLGNVLEHRPIEARRASPWLRSKRWAQRSPARAVAALLAALLVIGGPAVFGVQQAMASAELQQALTLAEDNFDAALDAVEYMLEKVGDETLANVPQMVQVRQSLLERALEFYRRFADQRAEDPRLLRRTARVSERIAVLLNQLARGEEARELAKGNIEIWRQLLARDATDPNKISLAHSIIVLAAAWADHGDVGKAEPLCVEARALLDSIADTHREDVSWLEESAYNLSVWMGVSKMMGERDRCLEAAKKRVDAYRAILPRSDDPFYRLRLAEALAELGGEYDVALQPDDAEAALTEALDRYDELLAESPSRFAYRLGAARTRRYLGHVSSRESGSSGEALMAEAIAEIEALIADYPEMGTLYTQLYLASRNLAVFESDRQNFDAADELFTKGIEAQRALYEMNPTAPEVVSTLAEANANLGFLRFNQQRFEAAADCCERAVELATAAIAASPGREYDKQRLVLYLSATIRVTVELKDHVRVSRAARAYARAVDHPYDGLRMAGKNIARCVTWAKQDTSLSESERSRLAEGYANEAFDLLLAAVEAGQDPAALAHSPELGHLRDHPRWPELGRLLPAGK